MSAIMANVELKTKLANPRTAERLAFGAAAFAMTVFRSLTMLLGFLVIIVVAAFGFDFGGLLTFGERLSAQFGALDQASQHRTSLYVYGAVLAVTACLLGATYINKLGKR